MQRQAFIVLLFLFVLYVSCCRAAKIGKCDVCMTNGVACVSETVFATCYEGALTDNLVTCPGGGYCTENALICRTEAQGFEPICYEDQNADQDQCDSCEFTNGRFACLDETSYGFCFGGNEPNLNAVRTCPSGYVCNHASPQVCVTATSNQASCVTVTTTDAATDTPTTPTTTTPTTTTPTTTTPTTTTPTTTTPTTTTPTTTTPTTTTPTTTTPTTTTPTTTTPTTTTPTTTTAPTTTTTDGGPIVVTDTKPITTTTTTAPLDPNAQCALLKTEDYFRRDGDTTCTKYIYCYELSNQWLAWEYTCSTYYNASTKKCEKNRPDDC